MYQYARTAIIPSFSAILRERDEDAEESNRRTTMSSVASGSS